MPNPIAALIGGSAILGAVGSVKSGKAAKKQAQFEAAETKRTAGLRAGFIESESQAQAGFI